MPSAPLGALGAKVSKENTAPLSAAGWGQMGHPASWLQYRWVVSAGEVKMGQEPRVGVTAWGSHNLPLFQLASGGEAVSLFCLPFCTFFVL